MGDTHNSNALSNSEKCCCRKYHLTMYATDTRAYSYTKRLNPGETRLLTLLSHGADGIMRCSLDVYGSSNVPEYQALSYCWGSEENAAFILIGRQHLRVGQNAHLALAYLCKTETLPIRIWVDAICINQTEDTEKSIQVGRMHAIYSNATLVIAWLGEAQAGFQGMLEEMVSLAKKPKIEWRDAKRWFDIADQLALIPWFSRVWVIQEAALARNVRYQHGDGSIPWDDIKIILDRRWDYTRAFPLVVAGASSLAEQSSLQIFGEIRMGATTGECQVKRLDHLILSLAGLKCRDPRDRIFGLAGIAERLKVRVPRIDYGGRHTFKDVLVHEMIQQFAALEDGWSALLSAQDHHTSGSLDVPSWMPNLEKRVRFVPLPYHLYAAGGPTSLLSSSIVSQDRSFLTITAALVCSVYQIAMRFTDAETAEDIGGYLESFFRQPAELRAICEETARRHPSRTLESNMEAIAATLAGDCVLTEEMSIRVQFFDTDLEDARRGTDTASFIKMMNLWSGTTTASKISMGLFKAATKAASVVPTSILSRIRGPGPSPKPNNSPALEDLKTKHREYVRTRVMLTLNRCLVVTNTGAFGLCPHHTQSGDLIVVSPGVNAPIVLRKSGRGDDRYVMVGGAYIHGLMDGEAMRASQANMKTFTIG